jgi:hypothetical protein
VEHNDNLASAIWAPEFHIARAKEAAERLYEELRTARGGLKTV